MNVTVVQAYMAHDGSLHRTQADAESHNYDILVRANIEKLQQSMFYARYYIQDYGGYFVHSDQMFDFLIENKNTILEILRNHKGD